MGAAAGVPALTCTLFLHLPIHSTCTQPYTLPAHSSSTHLHTLPANFIGTFFLYAPLPALTCTLTCTLYLLLAHLPVYSTCTLTYNLYLHSLASFTSTHLQTTCSLSPFTACITYLHTHLHIILPLTCRGTIGQSQGHSRDQGRWLSASKGTAHTAALWSGTRHLWLHVTS